MSLYFDIRPDFRIVFLKLFVTILIIVSFILLIFIVGLILFKKIRSFYQYKKLSNKNKELFLSELETQIEYLNKLYGRDFLLELRKFFDKYNLSFEYLENLLLGEDKKLFEEFLYKDVYNPKVESIIKSYLNLLKDQLYADFMK